MRDILKIPNVLELLCSCWSQAEKALQAEVKTTSPDINEVAVTQNFHSKLAKCLMQASKERLVESAFLSDLKASFPDLWRENRNELRRVSQGLIADVTLHEKETEEFTGGDFGVLIFRPNVSYKSSSRRITHYRRGLLTQAKMKRDNGEWGKFSSNQEHLLPNRLDYLALLLYSYDDKARRSLSEFDWQLCSGVNFDDVKDWLKQDSFPNKRKSSEIIQGLGNAVIGTDNNAIIDELISPEKNKSLVIHITWPDGKHPGSGVRVFARNEVELKAQMRLRH